MKHRKLLHILCLLAALCLLGASLVGCTGGAGALFVFPTRTLAGTETYTFGSYTYQMYDDGTVILIDYSGSEPNVVIPDTIDGWDSF